MKSNILTIIKKEFKRVINDRQLAFTTIFLPGLLTYVIYTFIGNAATKMIEDSIQEKIAIQVENMPQCVEPIFSSMGDNVAIINAEISQANIEELDNKSINALAVRFPADFCEQINAYDPSLGQPAPNVEIYYNSTNNATQNIFHTLRTRLSDYESSISNRFDINRADSADVRYNRADEDHQNGAIMSQILPLFILMMLFSGVMPVAQTSIAGEKERGTIATLLITPMKRNELAIGKICAISCLALLSAVSSFLGLVFSIPQMISAGGRGAAGAAAMSFNYTTCDLAILLLVIISTVLVMTALICILSTLAKDVRNAGMITMPLMVVLIFVGMISMFQSEVCSDVTFYLIPFYNSMNVMSGIFQHEVQLTFALVTIGANILFSLLSVWVLTKMFNSERIMFKR